MNKELFDPKSTAILVVDMQIGFIDCFSIEKWRALITVQCSFFEKAIMYKIPIIVILYERSGALYPAIDVLLKKHKDLVTYVHKNYDSAFHSTILQNVLDQMEVKTLVIVGINTCCCVRLTAKDAIDCGYNVIISRDMIDCACCRENHFADWSGFVSEDRCISTSSVDSILNLIESPQILLKS